MSLWTRGITDPGWVGVDLDGTLAAYEHGQWPEIGQPVPIILSIVKELLESGRDVRILTARVGNLFKLDVSREEYDDAIEQKARVEEWCLEHVGQILPVTAVKDYDMACLFDDRAVTVEKNTGRILTSMVDVLT